MKLHELAPAEGSTKSTTALAEAQAPAMVKLQVKVTRARMPVPAAVFVPVSKAARCLFTDVCPNVALTTTISQPVTRSSI